MKIPKKLLKLYKAILPKTMNTPTSQKTQKKTTTKSTMSVRMNLIKNSAMSIKKPRISANHQPNNLHTLQT